MKNLLLIGLTTFALSAFGQMQREVINKEYAFEEVSAKNVFQLSNIFGSINVDVHDKQTYELQAEQVIYGKTAERIQLGLQQTGLSSLDQLDTIIVYVSSPCHSFNKVNRRDYQGFGYDFQNCDLTYEYKFNISLKVPKNANLILRTVNDGDIAVRGVEGSIDVRNVNGAIYLEGVKGKVVACTINGDVDVNYQTNPRHDSKYYSLNGDIKANFKKGLAAKIAFKSFNGEMYSNLPSLTALPGEVLKEEVKEAGVRFKIEERNLLQSRGGTVLLDFETFNGDAIIKEK